MFTLATVEDSIRLDPDTFSLEHHSALSQEINRKYANKVIRDVGLCVVLYDVISAADGELRDGDGSLFVSCQFRLVVFAPFMGEILVGWISSCTPEGINVRMEFFDDVFVPNAMLFEGSQFVAKEQAWVWNVNDMDLFLDTNEKLRFRVERSEFSAEGMKITNNAFDAKPAQEALYLLIQIDYKGVSVQLPFLGQTKRTIELRCIRRSTIFELPMIYQPPEFQCNVHFLAF